jgi:hypothetical protein
MNQHDWIQVKLHVLLPGAIFWRCSRCGFRVIQDKNELSPLEPNSLANTATMPCDEYIIDQVHES